MSKNQNMNDDILDTFHKASEQQQHCPSTVQQEWEELSNKYHKCMQNYPEDEKVNIKKKSKKKNQNKVVPGTCNQHKQKSIYVFQREPSGKPHPFNFNLESVPEEIQPSSDSEAEKNYHSQNQDSYNDNFPHLKVCRSFKANTETSCDSDNANYYEDYMTSQQQIQKLLESCQALDIDQKEDHAQCSNTVQRYEPDESHHQPAANKDDSSWCDLTDGSSSATVKRGSVDGAGDTQSDLKLALKSFIQDHESKEADANQEYESKISNMLGIISSLRQENSILNEQIEKCEMQMSVRNKKAETSIHNLSTEVDSLRERLKELSALKSSPRSCNVLDKSKWRHAITTLKGKYDAVCSKNTELKAYCENMQQKLKNLTEQKEKDILELKENLNESHRREIEALQQNQALLLKDLEYSFTQKMLLKDKEYYDKMEEMRSQYERSLEELKCEYERNLELKNVEITRLENMIQEQCLRMQREVKMIRNQMEHNAHLASGNGNFEKVVFLQKCIYKMEKLFRKSQKQYTKQIDALRNELDVKTKTYELQLSKQRAELVSSSNTFNKLEVDILISNLEKRYKALLETQQAQALQEKQKDAILILDLREQLAKLKSEKGK